MEKNKNRVFKLLGLLVVVFLVCLCMLGSTFARYTTGTSGTATAGVAEWNVTASSDGLNKQTTTTIGNLSPMLNNKNSTSASDYSGTGGTKYVNLIYNKVATITITKIDVNAELQISYEDVKVNGTGNSSTGLGKNSTYDSKSTWSYDSGISAGTLTDNPTWNEVIGTALNFYVGYEVYTSNGSKASFSSLSESNSSGFYGYDTTSTNLGVTTVDATSGANSTINATSTTTYVDVYAWVTWTSDYSTYSADVVDAIDTWIGINVASVSATITCKLVQASTITSQDSSLLN